MKKTEEKPFDRLLDIMAKLRGEGGCPWDRSQNHQSLRPYVIEEAYELVEAIDNGQSSEICEELGDLLLQIVFHCQIASEENEFTFNDVADGISEKLLRRHPHVFGDSEAVNDEEALLHWERIKSETEGKKKTKRHHGTPILHRALRLQEKAVSYGFDWDETYQLIEKLEEEIQEIKSALESGDKDDIVEEIGDLFFMSVNLSRYLDVHPEDALERSITKFGKRFKAMEEMVKEQNLSLEDMSLDEMESFWRAAKELEKGNKK
jgi:tetrapyrrole methylase family protein/MazG family protein